MTLSKSILRVALVTAALLLIPLIAMQFKPAHEEGWSLFDFILAGGLLFGTGVAFELLARVGGSAAYRLAAALALGTALFLVWSNLAVGLLGNEDNPANLLYLGVLAVGTVGAVAARFRARGMANAMLAAALAQVLVPVLALLIFKSGFTAAEQVKLLLDATKVTAFFGVLWVGAALLFRRAAALGPEQRQRLA